MATEKSPAFQFYPKDFLSDGKVALMSLEQIGAYTVLLCHTWIEGKVPADPILLARLCHAELARFESEIWPGVAPCFKSDGNGSLYNPRLRKERSRQKARKKAKSSAGKRGAKARWAKDLDGTAIPVPLANDSSSSASSSASSTPEKKKSRSPNGDLVASANGHDPARKCFEAHLEARRRFYKARNGQDPPSPPTLTATVRKKINAAIKVHGFDKARAAGIGLFLSPHHIGQNDRETLYLKPQHAWRMPNSAGNGPDNVETFSELYFAKRAEKERKRRLTQ